MKTSLAVLCGVAIGLILFVSYSRLATEPRSADAEGGLHILVLCSTCTYGDPQAGSVGAYILDENNGKVWFYQNGIDSGSEPKLLGTLPELGKAMVPAAK